MDDLRLSEWRAVGLLHRQREQASAESYSSLSEIVQWCATNVEGGWMWEIRSLDSVLCRRWRSRELVSWWPSAAAVRAEAANDPELLRSRAVVVSVGESRAVSAAGVDHEGERKRTTDDVS
jgi:hypothetical protein